MVFPDDWKIWYTRDAVGQILITITMLVFVSYWKIPKPQLIQEDVCINADHAELAFGD